MAACSTSSGKAVWPVPGVVPGKTKPPVYVTLQVDGWELMVDSGEEAQHKRLKAKF